MTTTRQAFAESGGLVAFEAEHFNAKTAMGDHDWTLFANSAASGGQTLLASPNNGTEYLRLYAARSPRLDFEVHFTLAGTYYVWVRGSGASSGDDSCHVGLDGAELGTGTNLAGFTTSLSWVGHLDGGERASLAVASAGLHVVNVWMREDGLEVDKLVLTTDPAY
ncbi:MAG: hypothetical protein JW940_00315, partial [Polyangiaceae bacterium]|nr:hypothetical protein [Polyangiaceae bacterium]